MKRKLVSILAGFGFMISTCLPSYATNFTNQKKLEELVLSNSVKSKIVMFGEYHIRYRFDSDFVIGILPKLKEQGFNYFALELDRNPPETNKLKKTLSDYASGKLTEMSLNWIYPEDKSAAGWFDLINAVKKADMEIICYDANENELTSWNDREEIAFKNLKELIFDKYPDAKVIIYCGASHLNEKPTYDEEARNWEQGNGLVNNDKDGRYTCLAFHMNKHTRGKTFTVCLVPFYKKPSYCDLTIDLLKKEYWHNN